MKHRAQDRRKCEVRKREKKRRTGRNEEKAEEIDYHTQIPFCRYMTSYHVPITCRYLDVSQVSLRSRTRTSTNASWSAAFRVEWFILNIRLGFVRLCLDIGASWFPVIPHRRRSSRYRSPLISLDCANMACVVLHLQTVVS